MTRRKRPWTALAAAAGAAIALVLAAPAPALPPVAPPTTLLTCSAWPVCVHVVLQPPSLGSSIEDHGSGTVTSEPAGIQCHVVAEVPSGTCDAYLHGLGPTLDATLIWTPDTGSRCRTTGVAPGSPCTTALGSFTSADSSLTEYVPANNLDLLTFTLSVSGSGTGSGTVGVSPGSVTCAPGCSVDFAYGTSATLAATPSGTARFDGWTGACAGQPATCTVAISQDASTAAVFDAPTRPAATTTPSTTTTATTTTTSGGGASGGANQGGPGGPPPPTGPAQTDRTLDAQLLGVRVGKSKLGATLLLVEVAADEPISVDLALRRNRRGLAHKHLVRFASADSVVTLGGLDALRGGRASLAVTLTDAAGNRQTLVRAVRLPVTARKHTARAGAR
jgi:hypothetical protein